MFSSGSLRSISFATVTPSLVIVGDPNFLSRTTLRPLGPKVTFTASANWLTPRNTARRECSPYTICFAICFLLQCAEPGARATLSPGSVDDRQHFLFPHDEVFLAVELDLLAGILAEEDRVAGADVQGDPLAIVLGLAASGRDDLALLGLFLGRV